MKNIKKLSAALAMVLSASLLFSGCAKQEVISNVKTGNTTSGNTSSGTTASDVNKKGLPIVNTKQSLKVLVVLEDTALFKMSDSVLHKEIEKQTNVSINWVEVARSAWSEKKGLLLASNELPDVFLGGSNFTDSDVLNMASQRVIIPIDGLLEEYGENFQRLIKIETGLKSSITSDDGHIYGLPRYVGVGDGTAPYILSTNLVSYINKRWLNVLGLEMPKTTDDLEKVLLAFKTKDPNGNGKADEIPMSAVRTEGASSLYNDWFGAFGRVPADNAGNFINIGLKDGKAVFEAVQPEYKNAVIYFNKLYKQGLLDQESFTQDAKVFNAKLKNPTRTVGVFESWRGTSWRLNEKDDEYAVMPPLTGPNGDHVWPKLYNGLMDRSSFIITKACKNPELAIRWGDNLLAPDNAYQFWTGAKIGYNLKLNDKGTFDLIKKIDVNDPEQAKQGTIGIFCVDVQNEARKPIDPNPLNVDNEKQASDKYFKDSYPKEYYPNVFLNISESKIIQEKGSDINNFVSQKYAQWITKGGIEEEWNSYVKQLEDMGLSAYMAQYQSALDRYNKVK